MTLVPDTLVFVTRKGFLFASFFGFGLQSTGEAVTPQGLGFSASNNDGEKKTIQ